MSCDPRHARSVSGLAHKLTKGATGAFFIWITRQDTCIGVFTVQPYAWAMLIMERLFAKRALGAPASAGLAQRYALSSGAY